MEHVSEDERSDFWKVRRLHERSQLSCLAECFLMDGQWCNSRLPGPEIVYPTPDFSSFANNDYSGILYDTFAQTRFQGYLD